MIFFIWRKNVSFTRYLDFCVFVKSTYFKICDVIRGKLVPSLYMILLKWQYSVIWPFLIADIYHFEMSLIHLFKKMKHWNLDIIGYVVIRPGRYIEKDLDLVPVLQIVQKIPENFCPGLYLSIGQVWWLNEIWFKDIFKNTPFLCTNNHHVTELLYHGMVTNTNTWICWERNVSTK